jgi:hypothetical protein
MALNANSAPDPPPTSADARPDLLGQLQAAIDSQRDCSRSGDEEGQRRAGETVSRILAQLETQRDTPTSEMVRRLLRLRDAHRVACLAVAGEKQEIAQRLRQLARGKSAATAYGKR